MQPRKPFNRPQPPLTEEQKEQQVLRFFAQKREQFAVSILNNACKGANLSGKRHIKLVKKSVEMADALIQELYPLPEKNKEGEK